MKTCKSLLTLAALALIAPSAFAHPGHAASATLFSGLLHPLTGLDHLLVLAGLGLLVGLQAKTNQVNLFGLFSGGLLAGAATGLLLPAATALEFLVFASLFALPLLLMAAKLGGWINRAAVTLAFLFSVSHGAVQGAEALSPDYMAGQMLASIGLMVVGLVAARAMQLARLVAIRG